MIISKNNKIYLAGHKGMVGSAINNKLIEKNYKNVITRSRYELDLLDQKKLSIFLKK